MSPTTMPAPPRSRADSAGAIKRALRAAELVPASGWSQALAYVEIVLAISLLSVWLDRPSLALAAGAALAVGIVVSVATPIGGLFVNLSGAVVAVIAVVTALFIWAYAEEGVLVTLARAGEADLQAIPQGSHELSRQLGGHFSRQRAHPRCVARGAGVGNERHRGGRLAARRLRREEPFVRSRRSDRPPGSRGHGAGRGRPWRTRGRGPSSTSRRQARCR